jgi:hypothetical protein
MHTLSKLACSISLRKIVLYIKHVHCQFLQQETIDGKRRCQNGKKVFVDDGGVK